MGIPTHLLPPHVRERLGCAIASKPARAPKGTGRTAMRKATSLLEERFAMRWTGPAFVRQHKFHATRKWALDFAWPADKVGLEIHGAVWTRGRHTRGSGFVKDREKMNAAVMLGWRVIEWTAADLDRVGAIEELRGMLKGM